MQVSRRSFFKICAGGMAGTSAALLGFAPNVSFANSRQYKLLRSVETRNNCTYCSVGCGILMYSLGDGAKNAEKISITSKVTLTTPLAEAHYAQKGRGLLTISTVKIG